MYTIHPAVPFWDHDMWLPAPCWRCCALQVAATQSEAVSLEAHRRSCSWTGVAFWETPRGTQAATRATRTWRTVMTARVACEYCPLLPSAASSFTRKTPVVFSPSWCSSIPSHQIQFSCSSGKTRLIYFWRSFFSKHLFLQVILSSVTASLTQTFLQSLFFVCLVLLRSDITLPFLTRFSI